jgi:predicted nuclease with TOPRIM domain
MTEQDIAKIAQVMADGSQALRTVTSERDTLAEENGQLQEKLAAVQTRLECEKTAAEMHEKGLNMDTEFADLVDNLEKDAQEGRLPVIQEAVKMAAPNMGSRIAHINNDETSMSGDHDLVKYLVGSVG